MSRVALFGGSFNPPHIGHKQLIELVRDTFPCDEIWLLPSGNRHDKTNLLESKHRLAMAKLFAKELQKEAGAKIIISTFELEKKGRTTTIGTLRELRSLYPDHEFYFIISSELVPDIKKIWIKGEEVFATTHFIIVERPGFYKLTEIELPPHYTILKPSSPLSQISSTYVRTLSLEQELRAAVGDAIVKYIIENKLYSFKVDN